MVLFHIKGFVCCLRSRSETRAFDPVRGLTVDYGLLTCVFLVFLNFEKSEKKIKKIIKKSKKKKKKRRENKTFFDPIARSFDLDACLLGFVD